MDTGTDAAVNSLAVDDESLDEEVSGGATGELTIEAPSGAEFLEEEVKTGRGLKPLGEVPILRWRSLESAVAFYGEEGVKDILDGTSLRVSFQNIGRRMAAAGRSKDEIAQAQINFRPGKRSVGVGTSTPKSRLRKAAETAADTLGERGDAVAVFLDKLARNEISVDKLSQL